MIIICLIQKFCFFVRHPMHIIQCAEIGADYDRSLSAIIALLNHPLTDIGLEKFLADFKK